MGQGQRQTDPRGAIVRRAANGPKPDPSYLTPADAEDRLRTILAGAPRAAETGARRRGPLFAAVAAEWLEHGERKRGLKHSTLTDYRYLPRNHLLPAFGERPVRAITRQEIERRHAGYERTRTRGPSAHGPRRDPQIRPTPRAHHHKPDRRRRAPPRPLLRRLRHIQPRRDRRHHPPGGRRPGRGHHPHRRPHRPARGELLALHWRDIDFAGQAIRVRATLSYGVITTPKSGKVRVVPMVDDVAHELTRLATRDPQTADEDPVFASPLGGHLDASASRRRFVATVRRAGPRTLPYHSLRHFFGSMAVNKASLVQEHAWMGHAHIPDHRPLPAPSRATQRRGATGRRLPRHIRDRRHR